MTIVDFTPSPDLYPFQSHWAQTSAAKVHYVDEGQGRPILMLHGNPDWSFLYRNVITGLRDDFRCIAADYPGFGLSEHPEGYGYTAAEHAAAISELVEQLDLRDLIVFGADWGGPIGLAVALNSPERVTGFVLGNTWCWSPTILMRTFSFVMARWPMQQWILRRNSFVNVLMKRAVRRRLSPEEFAHYTDVFPDAESRRGVAEFPKQIRAAGPWLEDICSRVSAALGDRPTLLVWGPKDLALPLRRAPKRLRQMFPDNTLVELKDAGHFIQEDAPDEIVAAVKARFG
ncbi:MAG: alpha/beta fold hydrolase [Chloroflexi bacterium]|nr:alpha/beta fold hydrolase [Chloroflexota bacterium]